MQLATLPAPGGTGQDRTAPVDGRMRRAVEGFFWLLCVCWWWRVGNVDEAVEGFPVEYQPSMRGSLGHTRPSDA